MHSQAFTEKDVSKPDAISTDPPKLNVVVSLVNVKDELDSLSPAIQSQFLKISKEIVNATTERELIPADKEEKVYVTMETDEEMSLSQNEPLDLSIAHVKSQADDLGSFDFFFSNFQNLIFNPL